MPVGIGSFRRLFQRPPAENLDDDLLLGAQIYEVIADVIADPARQAEVTALADDFQARLGEFRNAVADRRTVLRKLNSDYDATREQFIAYIEKYDAQIESTHKRLMDSHVALVRVTTAAEWDKLSKADTKMMKELINSIQSI